MSDLFEVAALREENKKLKDAITSMQVLTAAQSEAMTDLRKETRSLQYDKAELQEIILDLEVCR